MFPAPLSRKSLSFRALRTSENYTGTFWLKGEYVPATLQRINHVLRDYRSSAVGEMDPKLMDALFALRQHMGARGPFEVISAYRSPESNSSMRKAGRGVAENSYHVRGMAIDIRLPGFDIKEVHRAALELQERGVIGGVALYRRSGFVHVDSGPKRSW